MKHVTNFPLFNGCSDDFGGIDAVVRDFRELGMDGLEVIWDHMPYTEQLPPIDAVIGYHLRFWAFWVDYWQGNKQALLDEYGDQDMIDANYHGRTQDDMIAIYREDLQRAIDLEAEYVVFHVSEVSLTETFTFDFHHADEEVIDASIELINRILDGSDFKGAFLMENQWWPGLRFADPALTRRLLDGVDWPNKGIMLDVGHLLSTNRKLRTQRQAADYVLQMYADHKDVQQYVRGFHLHKSLSGEFVESSGFRIPDDFTGTYWDKFARSYKHVLQIDRHEPWDDPAVADIVRTIQPEWVNHELSAWPREPRLKALATQIDALARGGCVPLSQPPRLEQKGE